MLYALFYLPLVAFFLLCLFSESREFAGQLVRKLRSHRGCPFLILFALAVLPPVAEFFLFAAGHEGLSHLPWWAYAVQPLAVAAYLLVAWGLSRVSQPFPAWASEAALFVWVLGVPKLSWFAGKPVFMQLHALDILAAALLGYFYFGRGLRFEQRSIKFSWQELIGSQKILMVHFAVALPVVWLLGFGLGFYELGVQVASWQKAAVLLILSFVYGPLLHETVFRGVVQTRLETLLPKGSGKAAAVLSAFLGALTHINEYGGASHFPNWRYVLVAFAISSASALLFHRVRNIWPSILLAAAFEWFRIFLAYR